MDVSSEEDEDMTSEQKAAAFDAIVAALYTGWDGVQPTPFVTKEVKSELRKALVKHEVTEYVRVSKMTVETLQTQYTVYSDLPDAEYVLHKAVEPEAPFRFIRAYPDGRWTGHATKEFAAPELASGCFADPE